MDKNLQYWEDTFQKQQWGKYPTLELVRFIAKNFYSVENRKSIKILELGSGPGPNLWYLAKEGFSVYGIEGSSTANIHAIQRIKDENLEEFLIEVKTGDYFDLLESYPDNFFDAIIDIESIYCNPFDKSQQIIKKSFKKLKNKGKFLSITFANINWHTNIQDTDYHAVNDPSINGFFRYTTKEDIPLLYKNDNNTIKNISLLELHLDENISKKEWVIELEKK